MRRFVFSLVVMALAGCGRGSLDWSEAPATDDLGEEGQRFSSNQASLLLFTFDGEVQVPAGYSARSAIDAQMLFTIGHLNFDRSVGRLDKLSLSNITSATEADGQVKVSYRAVLPVAWGSKVNLPTTYEFILPRYAGYDRLEEFTTKYKSTCVDGSAHDVDSGSMWYYYRPQRSSCAVAEEDVVRVQASAVPSVENTTGKYPEYHKVWEDNAFRVVAIFGKYEDGATSGDPGISGYNNFLRSIRTELSRFTLVTTPAQVPENPGVSLPDVTFEATLPDGKIVVVTALLVDNVRTAGAAFDARYEALSTSADLIAYGGHAGLGANVRALARKGKFVAGKYLMVFMNGCDTFAYVDGYLAETRRTINPDDPTGTKYMEIITNAMPSYFSSMPHAAMALVRGILKFDAPLTYDQMFASVDRSQVVVVTGEEDNVYFPGYQPGGGSILKEAGFVDRAQELRYETATLDAGKYKVSLAHDPQNPGGDADLYVRLGQAPTTSQYDCRPYKSGSAEECTVTVTGPAKLFLAVVGYARQASYFQLTVVGESAPPPPPTEWAGMNETGSLARGEEKRFETALVPAGKYVFDMTGTGDADLYVRSGLAPTATEYDCRPYKNGSAEQCVINLSTPAPLHLMVRGYAAATFTLVGRKEP